MRLGPRTHALMPAASKYKLADSYVAKGLLVIGLLTGFKLLFELTSAAHTLEQKTYVFLMNTVLKQPEMLPRVVVLDISQLPGGKPSAADRSRLEPTPRPKLLELLRTLDQVQPKAIGIDIDFSPERYGWIDNGDPGFFDECLRISKHVPIKLGVYRTLLQPPTSWLGIEKYHSLAGAVWLPKRGLDRLPIWVAADGSPDEARLPSLGAALASAAYKPALPDWAANFLNASVERKVLFQRVDEGLRIGDRIIDHSLNDAMWKDKIDEVTSEKILAREDDLRESIVILGDVVSERERFLDPVSRLDRTGVFFMPQLRKHLQLAIYSRSIIGLGFPSIYWSHSSS